MSDEITLVLPATEDFHPVAHLVVGGLAARLELTYEQLEDLQVAVEALLGCRDDDGDVSVVVSVESETVRATVGPFAAHALAELERDASELGLRRVLETVTDGFEVKTQGQRRVGHAVEGERGVVPRIDDKILLRKYHEEGDLHAREKLIEQYMSLVRSLARRYSYRGEQLEDLVQIGAIGLIKAIDRFDLERGVELTTYATPNIIGEIKRHFRDKGWAVRVPRGLQELNVQLSRLMEHLTVQLGRSPTIPELAKASGSTEEEVLEALESGRAYSSLSLSSSGGGADGEEDLDPLESIGTIEHQYEVSEDRAVLAPGFRALDERERMILQLRFFDGLTQSQIAQQVGISQMHVSRLIRRSLEKIRAEIARTSRRRAAAAASRATRSRSSAVASCRRTCSASSARPR